MSKEIEERVVEMRFDNEHFEKNVQTSMSTLDKLKQKLQFKKAGKGFEDIEKAAKNTDLSPLAKSADKVGLRFSAMYTVADQAFRNMTNSAMAAGKRIVDALTIDPIKTGLSEYETKINAVQVIKANTRGKFDTEAEQMEVIYKALDELNDYADRTIYNYAQMTDNVGKFVAQTGDVEKSVKAVQGLANLAGASGASAADMARATYQMSQALGGTIRKIDWNSLRNANMAGQELKNMLIDLAKVEGIDIDSMITNKGTFEDTLEEGWLTGDLFMKAMNIYSDAYSEAELAAMGFNAAQIANFKDLANTAKEATTEVKTFTQLFDVLKETAQSGWTQTWEIIFGDFDTAKKMFTELQVYFSDILNGFSEARNMLVEGAFNLKNPWSKILEKLNKSGIGKTIDTFNKVSSAIEDASDKVEHFQNIVNDVWRGDYKNADTGRYELLEAAGYNHKVIQDLVNKGHQYKITADDIEESHRKFGVTISENVEVLNETAEMADVTADALSNLTDEQLEQAGLTKEEIKLYRALADEADRLGISISDLVKEMSENDGRTMLIDSFKNAWSGLATIITAVRDAWVEVFPPMTVVQLYSIIKAINSFSEHLVVGDETAQNLTRTLKGVFAMLDVILTFISLPVKIAFKLLTQLLSVFNVDILSVTAVLGDMMVGFRDTIDSALDFTSVLKKIVSPVKNAVKAFGDWIDTLKESKDLPKDIANGIINWFGKAFKAVTGWFGNLGNVLQNGFGDVSNNAILGLINGMWNGLKVAGEVIVTLGETLINKICEVLGIHSPSTVFFAIGGFIVAGLLLGIKTFFPDVFTTISGYASKCVDIIKNIDFGSIFSAVMSSVTAIALLKISSAIQNLGQMFGGLDEMFEDIGVGVKKALTGFGSALKGIGASFRAKAVKDIAISLLILAGALVVLSLVPTDRLIAATAAIAVLGIVLGGLFLVLNKTSGGEFGKESFSKIGALILTMIGISASILILAKALETISDVNFSENWVSVLAGIASMVVMMGVVMAELVLTTKFIKGVDFGKLAVTIGAISALMLVMAISMKIFSTMNSDDFGKGIAFVSAFGAIVASLAALSQKSVNMKTAQIGSLVKNIGVAILLMAVTCKIIAGMSWGELGKAAVGIIGFSAIAAGLIYITKFATDKDIASAGKVISAVGVAMLLMALTGKIINTMTWEEMFQAMVGITALGLIVSGLIAATKLAGGKDLAKVGTTILMVSVAIGILGLVASLLSFMDLKHLAKGLTAVAILGGIMSALILATSKAQNCMANLIVMTVAITLMAAAVATLSLIDVNKLLASAGAMTAMILSFAAMVAATKFIDAKALVPLIALTAIVAVLAGIVAALSLIDSEKALTSTIALATLIGAVTVLLLATAAVGAIYAATGMIAATGLLGLVAMAGIMWVFSLALANLKDFSKNIPIIETLIRVMTIMTGLLVAISIVGPLALIGIPALSALSSLMIEFGAFAAGIGMLVTEFPQLETFLNTGIPLLEKLANGLGSIVSNFLTGLLSGLPEIGTMLTGFIDNAQGFISGVKMVDKDVLEGVGILVGAFLALTGADILSSIKSFFSGGDNPFESFGKGLTSIGTCITEFTDSVSSLTDEDVEAVKRGSKAIEYMADAASKIPNEGGWLAKLVGDNNISAFGSNLPGLGTNLNEFATNLGVFSEEQTSSIECASEAIKVIADAASELPNDGGWLANVVGDNNIETFGKKLPTLGEGIKGFADNTKGIGVESVDSAVSIMTSLSDLASNNLGKTADNIKKFGDNLGKFVDRLSNFIDEMKTISNDNISSAIDKLKSMVSIASEISGSDLGAIKKFGDELKDLAKNGIKKFIDEFTSSSSKSDAKDAINNLIGEAVKKAKSKDNYNKFKSAGKYLVEGFAKGVSENTYLSTAKAKAMAKAAEKAAKDELEIHSPSVVFNEIGQYVVKGLAEGIDKNTSAEYAIKRKAQNLVTAFQEEVDKHDLKSNIARQELDLWLLGDGKKASDTEKEAKELSYLNDELSRKKTIETIRHDEWKEAYKYFGENSKEEREAWSRYLDAQTEIVGIQTHISELTGSGAQNKLYRDMQMLDLVYENWVNNHPNAKQSVKNSKLLEHLNAELDFLRTEEENVKRKLDKVATEFTTDSPEYTAAYENWVTANANIFAKEQEILDAREQPLLELEEAEDRVRETEYELWLSRNQSASEQVKLAKEHEYLTESLIDAEEESAKKYEEYLKIVEREGDMSSAAVKTALADWNESSKNAEDIRNKIADNEKAAIEVEKNEAAALEESTDKLRESQYELWLSENKDASTHDKLMRELIYIEESIADAAEDVVKAEKAYNEALTAENANATDINEKLVELNEKKKIHVDLQQQKVDNEKSALALVEEENDITSEIAKIKYDIWKNTEGRKAKDAEDEIKQLEYLNKQLNIQNQSTNIALKEYNQAISEYGSDSIEATRAYKAYLNEVRSMAELRNEILDLEESAADRQKRLRDEQMLAATEYEDYIKRYEKYYIANGMSREDLEKDAKLVTGYDPNKIVSKITSKTNTALKQVATSSNYQSVLTGFSNMGTSYVNAISEGATSQAGSFVDGVSDIMNQCLTKIVETRPSWVNAGAQLANGLIAGINIRKAFAIQAVVNVATSMIVAARSAFDEHSPSRKFAEIGKYAILGLAGGLTDNVKLSDEAATNVGNSAIENLKASIRKISDVVNSDLDTQPTIRPVLDLSNIRSGTAKLNAMMSTTQAMAISDSRKSREHSDENQNGNTASSNNGNTYQFTQNNYSPKALSRTEIYRQTKNQFAAMKEVLA